MKASTLALPPLTHGIDFGNKDQTVVICVAPGKPVRPVRIRYADQNGVEHLTEWGAMTVPAGSTFLYIEIKPDAE